MTASRRIWLRAIVAGSALPLAARAQPSGNALAQASSAGHVFLRAAEARFIAAAADRMIPEDDHPSASQAGVVDYIDGQLAGPFGKGLRMYLDGPLATGTPEQGYQLGLAPATVYRESLDALLAEPRGRGFATLASQQQDAFLGELEAGAWMLGRVPSSIFFETLLSNVVEGYFADPAYGGNRDMAGWRMIGFPGAYAHFTQWVGRHNVRFDRPPIGMAGHGSGQAHGHGHGHGQESGNVHEHGAAMAAPATPPRRPARER